MAEAFLQILLDNLTSFIQGELGLFFGFKDEFENLKSTFTIQAVLEDAQEKQLKDKPLENWLHDILDECKSKAAKLNQTKYGCYHPKIIPFRYKIGKRMKEIMAKLDAIAAERSKFHLEKRTIEREAARRETVGRKKSYQLGELRNLNLYGSMEITHLERVKNDMDAKEANLSVKENLHSLSMTWDEDERPHRYESEEVEVLEALKPHSNLTCLTISGFRGIRLPDWMNHSVLKNVVSIVISGCKNCSCLPPFGELPCLKSLYLWSGSVEVEYVDSGFPTRRRFPSLRKLFIGDFHNLKGLLKKEGEEQFPVLEEMSIHLCPMFVIPTLSSVKKLVVFGDKSDAIGFSSISNLRALSSLHIKYSIEATSLPEEMFTSLANLKYLNIYYFKNLKELPTSLASLNALKHLDIY